MYDLIKGIIAHEWVSSNYSGDQQYIIYIAGCLITIYSVAFVDAIKSLLRAYLPGRRKE